MTFQDISNFLNQNIISEVIGAFIFGLIAAFLFHKYSKTQETKELINKISFHLKREVEENRNSVEIVEKILAENKKKWNCNIDSWIPTL